MEMKRVLRIMLVLTSVGSAHPQESSTVRHADVYSIYSILMTGVSGFEGTDATYAIAGYTKPPMGRFPLMTYPCIEPPSSYGSRWTEVLADFNARIDKPSALSRDLTISKPYMLITAAEVAAFQAARMSAGLPLRDGVTPPASLPLDAKFQSTKHIFFLSDVYFSTDGTLALTGIANWCAGLCASGQWKIHEKNSAGRWVEVLPAKNCRVEA